MNKKKKQSYADCSHFYFVLEDRSLVYALLNIYISLVYAFFVFIDLYINT